jgi:carboxyl-terminal processing protease
MMKNFKLILKFLLILAALIASFTSGFYVRDVVEGRQENWPILKQAYSILENHGLKDLPPKSQLEYGMIRGLLNVYDDPYTIFVEPAEHELESDNLKGSFGGIGVRLDRDAAGNLLLYPFPESPAAAAGVVEGDILLAVDDLQITPDVAFDVIQAQLRGPVGSRVKIRIQHQVDSKEERVTIRRAEIPLPSVTWHLYPQDQHLGIVEINLIASSTAHEVQQAIQDMSARGASRFVLDMRDNFGGLLDTGVDVAR